MIYPQFQRYSTHILTVQYDMCLCAILLNPCNMYTRSYYTYIRRGYECTSRLLDTKLRLILIVILNIVWYLFRLIIFRIHVYIVLRNGQLEFRIKFCPDKGSLL